MRIIDIAEIRDKADVLCYDEDDTVYDAIQGMAKRNVGSAVIIKKDRTVCGIFTERDVMMKVAAKGLDMKATKLKAVMVKDVKTGRPEDTILNSLRRMSQGRFRHLPIVDKNNKLIGLISQGDFVALSWGQMFQHFTQDTKTSFMSYTQLWMMVIGIMIYISVILYVLVYEVFG